MKITIINITLSTISIIGYILASIKISKLTKKLKQVIEIETEGNQKRDKVLENQEHFLAMQIVELIGQEEFDSIKKLNPERTTLEIHKILRGMADYLKNKPKE